MEIKDLKNNILKNEVPSLMVFYAEEPILAKQFIKQISTTLNKYYRYFDKAEEVLYELSTNLKDDYLFIILNDESVLKNPVYLQELSKPNRNVIVYFDELDTKSDFYKNNKDLIVSFRHLSRPTIIAYVQTLLEKNKLIVTQDRVEKFVDFCDCNYSLCCNELDKVLTLGQSSSNLVVDYMLKEGFSDYRQTNIFSFIQDVLNKNPEVFDKKCRMSEPLIGFLFNLYKQAKARLEATGGQDLRYVDIMQLCSSLDSCVKDGTLNADYLLNYLLLKVI